MYAYTARYIRLAIAEYLPLLAEREATASGKTKDELRDLIDMFEDIAREIDKFGLSFADPNMGERGEPDEIELRLEEPILTALVQLVARMLEDWKMELAKLKGRGYETQDTRARKGELEHRIDLLSASFQSSQSILSRYSSGGPIIFPGDKEAEPESSATSQPSPAPTGPFFPPQLITRLPSGIPELCDEFNFNYSSAKPNACMLLLRRILPLAIVRKFQQENRESEIRTSDGYLDTKALIGKVQALLSSKRIYQEIMAQKFLIDSSQHLFTIRLSIDDVPRPANAIRILLEDLFQ
jgi:hypothetical protein